MLWAQAKGFYASNDKCIVAGRWTNMFQYSEFTTTHETLHNFYFYHITSEVM